MKLIIHYIDQLNSLFGKLAGLLVILLTILICFDVSMRYLFAQGSVGLQELEWHLFSLIFLLGLAHTYQLDEHVRVDLLYNSQWLSNLQRAWINVIGIIVFLLPFCVLVLLTSWSFVETAFYYLEASPDPGGLPYRYLIKGSILVGFSLLTLQGIAELLRNIQRIKEAK
jgi:TRAP-type mannitol/chloroaromatic compound transport system permease small subunit